jgi:hypothetical protein
MVSGFEKRMFSGMFALLSVDCAKAGEAVPATVELTPPHYSITSSARPSSIAGTSMPSAFAVLRLMTSWLQLD